MVSIDGVQYQGTFFKSYLPTRSTTLLSNVQSQGKILQEPTISRLWQEGQEANMRQEFFTPSQNATVESFLLRSPFFEKKVCNGREMAFVNQESLWN